MFRLRILFILSLSAISLVFFHYYTKVFGFPGTYFLELNQCINLISVIFIIVLILFLMNRFNGALEILSFLLLMITGYAYSEVIYARFPINIDFSHQAGVCKMVIDEINNYLIHRSYQYFPLLYIFLIYFSFGKNDDFKEKYFHFGDWNQITELFDKSKPVSWKKALLRFSLISLALSILILFFRYKMNMLIRPVAFEVVLLPFDVLGAANNCFVEEFIFRGMMLTVFAGAVGTKWGNFIQAFLFGLIHFPSFSPLHLTAKIIVFTFIGWIFGRAAIETKGIKTSWVFHTVIVASLYIAQTI